MKFSLAFLTLLAAPVAAFLPAQQQQSVASRSAPALLNYLDDLNGGKVEDIPEEEEEDDSRDATKLAKEGVVNGGVGDWSTFVDFNEFDGGDGQMGVAGDGSGNKLESFDMSSINKSRDRSAKNAWGTSSGYADDLREKGMEGQRAQQLENWKNQQEVLAAKKNQRFMTEEYDTSEDNQWDLSKFGVERNQDFDLNDEFGEVIVGDIEGTIELKGAMNQNAVHQFSMKNEYMGFADFRAAFTADTPPFWTIDPAEGSLDKSGTEFTLRFKPQSPSVVEGYLVIETEDFKKTWKLVGGV